MALDDPDLSVVSELQQGSGKALNELMRRHQEPLFRFIYRYLLDEEDARDLLQETFVRVYFKRDQFRPQAKFSTWLYRIALNLCRDYVRSRRGREKRQTESLTTDQSADYDQQRDFPDSGPDPSRTAQQNEAMAILESHIQALPHDLKAAFILVALEERSQKESAEILGVTIKAVETRVYRARKILSAKISPTS